MQLLHATIFQLADSTLGTLNALWDEIGFAKHERDNAQSGESAGLTRPSIMPCTRPSIMP
jgi:hypothetical protein